MFLSHIDVSLSLSQINKHILKRKQTIAEYSSHSKPNDADESESQKMKTKWVCTSFLQEYFPSNGEFNFVAIASILPVDIF